MVLPVLLSSYLTDIAEGDIVLGAIMGCAIMGCAGARACGVCLGIGIGIGIAIDMGA